MTLHCVTGNVSGDLVERLVAWLEADDAVLLLGAAANLARHSHPLLPVLLDGGSALYALEDDLALHGVSPQDHGVEAIDYATFVTLSVKHPRQLLWR